MQGYYMRIEKEIKKEKSKGRANTWDFSSDFIEGISQCLGQKFELDKVFDQKQFENPPGGSYTIKACGIIIIIIIITRGYIYA